MFLSIASRVSYATSSGSELCFCSQEAGSERLRYAKEAPYLPIVLYIDEGDQEVNVLHVVFMDAVFEELILLFAPSCEQPLQV
jgi:hypothetical protein